MDSNKSVKSVKIFYRELNPLYGTCNTVKRILHPQHVYECTPVADLPCEEEGAFSFGMKTQYQSGGPSHTLDSDSP